MTSEVIKGDIWLILVLSWKTFRYSLNYNLIKTMYQC